MAQVIVSEPNRCKISSCTTGRPVIQMSSCKLDVKLSNVRRNSCSSPIKKYELTRHIISRVLSSQLKLPNALQRKLKIVLLFFCGIPGDFQFHPYLQHQSYMGIRVNGNVMTLVNYNVESSCEFCCICRS